MLVDIAAARLAADEPRDGVVVERGRGCAIHTVLLLSSSDVHVCGVRGGTRL